MVTNGNDCFARSLEGEPQPFDLDMFWIQWASERMGGIKKQSGNPKWLKKT